MLAVEDLLEYREIEHLKYRYLRAADTHDWELMGKCLAGDADIWFNEGMYTNKGRENIVDFFQTIIIPSFISSHIALHPELKLTSPTSATGIWRLQDIVHYTEANPNAKESDFKGGEEVQGAGYYYDEYIKIGGEWLIKSTGYVRMFEKITPRDERPDFLLNTNPKLGVRHSK